MYGAIESSAGDTTTNSMPITVGGCLDWPGWGGYGYTYSYPYTYDRGTKALSIVRKLIDAKHIKVGTVEQFIKIMDDVITLL